MQPFIDFISNYSRITGREMKEMLQRSHFSSFKRNELVFKQGAVPKKTFFIIKGAVRWFYTDEKGAEHTVNFAFDNYPVVPFRCFENSLPSEMSAVTLKSTYMLWTSHEEFFSFMKTFPKYEKPLRTLLNEYMKHESMQAKLLRMTSARERYETLCKLRPQVIRRVPQKYIASYLGMADETLSRVRAGKL